MDSIHTLRNERLVTLRVRTVLKFTFQPQNVNTGYQATLSILKISES